METETFEHITHIIDRIMSSSYSSEEMKGAIETVCKHYGCTVEEYETYKDLKNKTNE